LQICFFVERLGVEAVTDMAKKEKSEKAAPSAKPTTAFVENEQVVTGTTGSPRVSMRLTAEGAADWDGMREATRQQVVEAIVASPAAISAVIAASPQLRALDPTNGMLGMVTQEHMKRLLSISITGEKMLMPRFIEQHVSQRLKRPFKLDPDVVQQGFAVPQEQIDKVSIPLAQAANEHLPQRVKEYIVKVGPLGEALAGLTDIVKTQLQTVIMLQLARDGGTEKSNGEVRMVDVPPVVEVGQA